MGAVKADLATGTTECFARIFRRLFQPTLAARIPAALADFI
jgi:hypothetical protein